MILTILTPTYNRGELLKKAYQSLLNESIMEFNWIIIDDGSSDNTEDIVNEFIKENIIEIRYFKKNNGGKHTALNFGIKYINTELTIILDSDDVLTADAVKVIYRYHEKYKENNHLCGYSFLKAYTDGKINGGKYPIDEKIESYIDGRLNRNILMDKAEVFYTKCLKEFPFPEYPGEKFLPEDAVWILMALKYDMVHINEVIYISEYLEDGLTKHARQIKIASPYGAADRANMLMNPKCYLKTRIKGSLLFVIYSKFAKKSFSQIMRETSYKGLVLIGYPFAFAIYLLWKKRYYSSTI